MKKRPAKRRILKILCIALAAVLLSMPIATVAVYEAIFCRRYETAPWLQFSAGDFDGLQVQRSDFESAGETLAGYMYSKPGADAGVVVLAHGLGGGGHNHYMPLIDYFTSGGYCVFTYDARGNDNSGGKSVRGLPQGIIDLDSAISHAEGLPQYEGLPFMLFGHSWGAFSSANVLALHPEIEAAVIVAGFNESEDLLRLYGETYAGKAGGLLMPLMELYEYIKFGGKYASLTALEGFAATDAEVLIVHSADDETVPVECGYDIFHEAFGDSERFEFVLYEDRGHGYPFCSEEAAAYRDEINAGYDAYIHENGLEYSDANKEAFMDAQLDMQRAFEPDAALIKQIIDLYNSSVQ